WGRRRYAKHFARVAREAWNDSLVPVSAWLACDAKSADGLLPYVLAVDDDNALHRVIVDQRLMNAAVRCRTLWHRLQEQGGIHNSHAERLLALDRAARTASPPPVAE